MLIESLSVAVVVVVLTHVLGVGDFYLHSTTVSVLVPLTTPLASGSSALYGLVFNQSIWPEFEVDKENGSDWKGENRVFGQVLAVGWKIAYNLTDPTHPFKVISLSALNDSAILVPLSASALTSSNTTSTSFTFPTFGVHSDCKILTLACMDDNLGIPVGHCSQAGYPWIPSSTCVDESCDNRLFAVVNNGTGIWDPISGQSFPNTTIAPNPVTFVSQLKFFGGQEPKVVPETSGVTHPYNRFFSTCAVEYFNATVSYDPRTDSFDLVTKEITNPATVTTMWTPVLAQYVTDRLMSNLQGTVLSLGKNELDKATALLNQEMSRLAIGSTGGFFMPAPAITASKMYQAVLGAYPVPAVFMVVGILYLYAAFAIFIFATSMSASSYGIAPSPAPSDRGLISLPPMEKQALTLGQTWLTNSLPLVGFAFPDRDKALHERRSVAEDPLDMINDVYEERLVLGIHQTENGTVFGVQRQSWVKSEKEEA